MIISGFGCACDALRLWSSKLLETWSLKPETPEPKVLGSHGWSRRRKIHVICKIHIHFTSLVSPDQNFYKSIILSSKNLKKEWGTKQLLLSWVWTSKNAEIIGDVPHQDHCAWSRRYSKKLSGLVEYGLKSPQPEGILEMQENEV